MTGLPRFQVALEDGHMDIKRSWIWKDGQVFSKVLIGF
jgi:hypothetical protein